MSKYINNNLRKYFNTVCLLLNGIVSLKASLGEIKICCFKHFS